jgi:hypothetical protein
MMERGKGKKGIARSKRTKDKDMDKYSPLKPKGILPAVFFIKSGTSYAAISIAWRFM